MKYIKAAYLWVNSIEGFGCVNAINLINSLGGIKKLCDVSSVELNDLGIPSQWIRRIINTRNMQFFIDKLESILSSGINVICIEDKEYPKILNQIHDPPLILYVKGNIDVFNKSNLWIGMVGTRKPSDYGEIMAKDISRDLSKLGIGIVSGMAKGIDGICHKMAISNEGNTIGVLGNGCNIVYPKSNAKLYDEIIEKGGALISEFEPNKSPLKHHFPRRNRIISGLSSGVLVVEAGIKSGSLITAQYALEQGRIVMCVPENVNLERAKGNFHLLRQGAIPISCANDICEEFNFQLSFEDLGMLNNIKAYNTTLEKTLAMIEPATASQIADKMNFDISEVLIQLTYLEIKGRIVRKYGGMYVLKR